MTKPKKIYVGIILGAHGVRGQVKLGSLTENPEDLFSYAPLTDESGTRVFELTFRGVGSDHFLASVAGVTDRDAAEKLKNQKLYIDRDALPEEEEGEYYFADLEGLTAKDADGKTLGVVEAVHDYGAGVFLEIKPAGGKSFMLPFKDAFVPHVDLAKGELTALVPEGWLKEEAPENEPAKDKPAKTKQAKTKPKDQA